MKLMSRSLAKPANLLRRNYGSWAGTCRRFSSNTYGSWVSDPNQLGQANAEDPGMSVFGGYANEYDAQRPGYPGALWDAVVGRLCGTAGVPTAPRPSAVDIATGTGRGALELMRRGLDVTALDADAGMLAQVVKSADGYRNTANHGSLGTRQARAEKTGLPDNCTDLVTALQAFHWFDTESALAEFHRILKKGDDVSARGLFVVAWNDRDLSVPWMCAYESLIEARNPKYSRSLKLAEVVVDGGRVLTQGGLFELVCEPLVLANPVVCSLEDVLALGRTFSYIRNALSDVEQAGLETDVSALVRDTFGENTTFEFPWVTKAWVLRTI